MNWITKPIGAFCHTGSGGTPSRQQESRFYGGRIPWVKSGELKESIVVETEETITEAALAESSAKIIPPGALLVAMYGATVGRIAILGIEAASNQAVCHIVPDKSAADQRYLFYALRTQVPRWLEQRVGGAQPNINQQIIRDTQIPLPPLEEQRRIAAILDKADAVCRKRQSAIALTEELLRSAFLEMFGDPVTNPKGWETISLGKLLAEPLQNGAYFPKNYYVEDGTGTEMVHMSDAFYGIVKRGNLKQVTVTSADIEKYELKANDILIARRSLNYEGSAKPCLIPAAQKPLIFESSLIRVRLNRDILDPIFFFSYMLQPRARETYVFPHVTRSTISGINQAGLQRVQVLVPPISIQKDYRRLYERVDSFGSSHKGNIELLDNLFNSLLQRAFRGEL